MNAMYTFSFSREEETKEHVRKISASSYANAIEKACILLEELNDDLDLLGLEDWEEVQDECADYGLYVSDLNEEYDE